VRAAGGRRAGATHLAGWVFADLTLVILLLVLVMTPAQPVAEGRPEPSAPSITASSPPPTPKPSGVEPSQSPVLELEEVPKIRLAVPNADLVSAAGPRRSAEATLVRNLDAELSRRGLTGRQAGLLLVFGAAPTPGFQDSVGRRSAERASQAIKRQPGFRNAKHRAYWTYGDRPTFVEVEIFFFDD
jgi:hypothetical protein